MAGKEYNDTLLAMKPLTLFLFLSLSLAGFGQGVYYPTGRIDTTLLNKVDSVSDEWRKEFLWRDSLSNIRDSISPKYDTVAVWIECADTTKPISYNMTVSGYEVTKTYWVPEYWDTRGFYLTYHEAYWQTDHVCYLDHFKKPLPFLGWGTKERK